MLDKAASYDDAYIHTSGEYIVIYSVNNNEGGDTFFIPVTLLKYSINPLISVLLSNNNSLIFKSIELTRRFRNDYQACFDPFGKDN